GLWRGCGNRRIAGRREPAESRLQPGLAAPQRQAAPQDRYERDDMNVRLKRTPGLYLVGFMGSGKSTVGRHLVQRLGWSFFDLDHEIEAAEKTTIAELFDTRGEPEFRRIESEMLH